MKVGRSFSIEEVGEKAWRVLEPPNFPFFDYEFLRALERSGCVGPGTGWEPVYLVCREGEDLRGALPLYVKTDSYGEYIFDWDWAYAYHERGLPYYPKLVAAVPFTPATGPRLLTRLDADTAERSRVSAALLDAARDLGEEVRASSTHALFLPEAEVPELEERGFAVRHSMQFHWRNRGYDNFSDYLDALQSKRRRQILRERRQLDEDLTIDRLTGEAAGGELAAANAAAMYGFYISTSERKWGSPYLNRAFFDEVFRTMADRILYVVARDGEGWPVAGTLNFFKGDALYGRYWGALEERRNLHFELCYYQPLEFAIGRRIALFEAGAQGEHKLARGFLPTLTYSVHEIRHPMFRPAIERYIEREKEIIAENLAFYREHDPYRD
jgi:predicted N-acyltransferase